MIAQCLSVFVSCFGFLLTFATVWHLVLFLSSQTHVSAPKIGFVAFKESSDTVKLAWAILVNLSLLCAFILQHSGMTHPNLKALYEKLRISVVGRSIYIIFTSLSLLAVMYYWHPIPSIYLWNIDVQHNSSLWWLFTLLHCFAWIIIYFGSLTMDISEMLGVKQVYYYTKGFPDPLSLKSDDLKRLYSHMRHPSFVGFFIIFWVHPLMRLDRFLLAMIWTLYMMLCWSTDYRDYMYQQQQLTRKKIEVKNKTF